MSYGGPCRFCGHDVDANFAAYPIRGWEVLRSGGGANRIVDRERIPGMIAHISCVEDAARKKRRGISLEQETLT